MYRQNSHGCQTYSRQYPMVLPSGAPIGPQYGSALPQAATPAVPSMPAAVPAVPAGEQPVTTLSSINYTPGYLRTQIGRYVKVEFLIGTNMLIDREGTLMAVGTSYIILQEPETDDLLLCDMYSIKFVRFYY
jgi:hypothetical protein